MPLNNTECFTDNTHSHFNVLSYWRPINISLFALRSLSNFTFASILDPSSYCSTLVHPGKLPRGSHKLVRSLDPILISVFVRITSGLCGCADSGVAGMQIRVRASPSVQDLNNKTSLVSGHHLEDETLESDQYPFLPCALCLSRQRVTRKLCYKMLPASTSKAVQRWE